MRMANAALRRLLLVRLLRFLGPALLIGAGVGVAGVCLTRLWPHAGPWVWWVAWPLVAAALAATALTVARRPALLAAAATVDHALRLRDRFTNGVALSGRDRDDPFSTLALEESERAAQEVNLRRALPLRFGPTWGWTPAALLAAIAVGLFVPQRTPAAERIPATQRQAEARQRAAAAIAEAVEQAQQDVDPERLDLATRERLKALEDLERQLLDGRLEPGEAMDEALRTLDEAAEQEQEAARQALAARDAVRERLARAGEPAGERQPSSPLAEALRRGDLEAARREAESLLNRREQITPEEADQLAEDLRQLAESLQPEAAGAPQTPPDEGGPGDVPPDQTVAEPPGDEPQADEQQPPGEPRTPLEQALREQGVPPEQARELAEQAEPEEVRRALEEQGVAPEVAEQLEEQTQQQRREEETQKQAEQEAQRLSEALREAAESLQQRPERQPQPEPSGAQQQQQTQPEPDRQPPETGEQGAEQQPGQQQQQQPQPAQRQPGQQQQPGAQPQQEPGAHGEQQQPAQEPDAQGESRPEPEPQPGQPGQQPAPPQPGAAESQQRPTGQGQQQQPQPQADPDGEQPGQQQVPQPGQQQVPQPGEQPGQQQVPQPGEQPGAEQQPQPGEGQGQRDGLRRLAEELQRQQQSGESSEQSQRNAERLREQARRMYENASPEERERLRRWAQQAAREVQDQQGRAPGSGEKPPFAQGPPGQSEYQQEVVDARSDQQPAGDPRRDQVIAEWYSDQPAEGGEVGSAAAAGAIARARRAAERDMGDRTIHPRYHELLREYFRRLPEGGGDGGAGGAGASPGGTD